MRKKALAQGETAMRVFEECPVCFAKTCGHLGPCEHVLCAMCAARWCSKSASCPTCRGPTFGLLHPPPLAPNSLMVLRSRSGRRCRSSSARNASPERELDVTLPRPCIVRLLLSRSKCAGITLTTNAQGCVGLRITKLDEQDQGFVCGLRVGDTVVSINGVPVVTPKVATRMIDAACNFGDDVVLSLGVIKRERIGRFKHWWSSGFGRMVHVGVVCMRSAAASLRRGDRRRVSGESSEDSDGIARHPVRTEVLAVVSDPLEAWIQ